MLPVPPALPLGSSSMIRLSWALCEGWMIGYLLAGPRRDPVLEAELDFLMGIWRLGESFRHLTPTLEEAGRAFAAAGAAVRAAGEQ